MDARRFIRAKRERRAHSREDIHAFISGALRGEVADYQVAAWLMAAFLNGLDGAETEALTGALVQSGQVFDWSALGRPSVDKHSTGGVGDKVSLILAPLVAACGVMVPTVAGRGLGHTGGTLDKLEAIPGFRVRLSADEMRRQLDRIGVVMVGQGPELAPADGMLYALRDVTSTVEFEPFIVSSVVSKKIAEGAEAIIYDVKCGNGAFMTTLAAARSLGRALVATTRAMGRKSSGLISDMSQPLGSCVGNTLEVREAIATLRGTGPPDVRGLTLELAARMLVAAGTDASLDGARDRATKVLDGGMAWERFVAMVGAQGGDPAVVENLERLEAAPVLATVRAKRSGWIEAVDTFALGELGVRIGAGRRTSDQAIDPRVGLVTKARIGDRVEAGAALVELHLASENPGAVAETAACYRISETPVDAPALLIETLE